MYMHIRVCTLVCVSVIVCPCVYVDQHEHYAIKRYLCSPRESIREREKGRERERKRRENESKR